MPHTDYDPARLLAHRAAVAAQFEIPLDGNQPPDAATDLRAQRDPAAVRDGGGWNFSAATPSSRTRGAAIGPGACYRAEHLVGLEIRPAEADRARRNVEKFRNDGAPFPVQILGQDALPWLRAFDGSIDLLYLDADGPRG